MMHHINELDGTAGTPSRLTRSICAQGRLRRHYTASRNSCIVSGLRWIRFCYLSFNSLWSRGGHAFPALIAARLASRIATICFACERVSSRRLAKPPRFPIAARYARTSFLFFTITAAKNAS